MKRSIITVTGREIDILNFKAGDVDIYDVAHALAMKCRFSGHCKEFYSVAQHSVHVSEICPQRLAIHGLLHDVAEAYIPDIATPYKREFPMLVEAERLIMDAVYDKLGLLGLDRIDKERVKHADTTMMYWEGRCLMKLSSSAPWGIARLADNSFWVENLQKVVSWSPDDAKAKFLARFHQIHTEAN